MKTICASAAVLLVVVTSGWGAASSAEELPPASEQVAPKDTPRTPVATVRALVRAATARDGEKACALVTAEGRSVIDAPTQSGRQACVESVEDLHDGEIDVRLVRGHTVRHTPTKATVAAVLEQDGTEEAWKLHLVHRRRGWLVDGAQLAE